MKASSMAEKARVDGAKSRYSGSGPAKRKKVTILYVSQNVFILPSKIRKSRSVANAIKSHLFLQSLSITAIKKLGVAIVIAEKSTVFRILASHSTMLRGWCGGNDDCDMCK